MNIEEIRDYFLSKKATTEGTPFDKTTIVFKVKGKMYGLLPTDKNGEDLRINVKCEPEKAIELRDNFSFVIPGYHMNKKHWNTIIIQEPITRQQITQWIDDSYNLVVEKLTKKMKEELANQ
ncbi:MAG: MmcQ/YjbR family DNA-binding protein [Bacteroidales bacterium]|nr:MmcQ/YjbR family DNA-binding protein [Bacteroidales bacterium]